MASGKVVADDGRYVIFPRGKASSLRFITRSFVQQQLISSPGGWLEALKGSSSSVETRRVLLILKEKGSMCRQWWKAAINTQEKRPTGERRSTHHPSHLQLCSARTPSACRALAAATHARRLTFSIEARLG